MDKLKNISVLFFTCGNCRPDTLTPSHARIATSTLRYPAVNNSMTNRTLTAVICWLNGGIRQKTKICFRCFALKSASQFFRKFMIRRSSHSAQKPFLNLIHPSCKPDISQFITAMQRLKQFFKSVQQLLAPVGQLLVHMFGKETYLANKMSHAVLNGRIAEPANLR